MSKLTLNQHEDSLYKQIYLDYEKTKEDIEEYIEIILKWCRGQAHFPEIPRINAVRMYLAACKCSIERTKEKLDMYYTVRRLMPEFFTKHPLYPELVFHTQVMYVLPFPKSSYQQRIIYSHLNPDFGPEDFVHELFVVQINHVIELMIQEDTCYKLNFIFDCKNIKMGHLSKFSPMIVKKCGICLEKVYAHRINKMYLVNFHPFLENVINTVFRPFLPAKLTKKLKTFKNTDILFEDFDRSVLPRDLGGDEKSFEELRLMLIEKYEELKPRFDQMQFMTVDESKRPQQLENDDILGYYGSFKKISVD